MRFNKTYPLFAIEVDEFKTNLDLPLWINNCYEYKNLNPKSMIRSNSLGYQSDDNLHLNPLFKSLREYLETHLGSLTVSDKKCELQSMWVNISPKYSFNHFHLHVVNSTNYSNTQFSGVLYLQTPPNSGDITFVSKSNLSINADFTPSPNTLYIFPQDLPHFVNQNMSNEDRISIAFNGELI